MAGVTQTNRFNSASADGSTTVFNFTFFVYSEADIKVYSVLNDVETEITSGITKAINSSFIGGTVTFDTAPLAAVGEILIRREVAYEQTTEFADLTRRKESAIETALNNIVLQVQQLASDSGLALQYGETGSVTNAVLGSPTDGYILKFDGTTGRVVGVSPTAINVDDLDTLLTTLSSDDFLIYNGTAWVNETLSETMNKLGIAQDNKNATAAPTVNDDSGDGYSIGSRWFDGANDNMYHCLDATAGAAVWVQGDIVASDLGAMALLAIASQAQAEARALDTVGMTPLKTGQSINKARQETIHVRNEQASGTVGGVATTGSLQTLVLNRTVHNNISGASLASNTITLPAGTYKARARAPFYRVDGGYIQIYNVDDATEIERSANFFSSSSTGDLEHCHIEAKFTLASEKDISLRYRVTSTGNTSALGTAMSFSGVDEIFAEMMIEKIG